MWKKNIITFLITAVCVFSYAQIQEFSTAGFYEIPNAGRWVYSMNNAWRIHKGVAEEAYKESYNDSAWPIVSLPNGIELQPVEASGGTNYQGEVWYRKHFSLKDIPLNKKTFLHFEGIMGKSKIYLNGKLIKEHFGGYLPIVIDVTHHLNKGENLLSVWADNSNDPNYPPGKKQEMLDFTYSGGIYRDCYLITHDDIHITDPNFEDIQAGGGLLVAYDNVSTKSADINLFLNLKNESQEDFNGYLIYELRKRDGTLVTQTQNKIFISSKKSLTHQQKISVKNPSLWSPDAPNLYNLIVKVTNHKNQTIDGYRKRIGIRTFDFKGKEGFWLNGVPYGKPLIGANRHQDFAVLGNAMPNTLHWRDAKKLKDAGLKVIRNAHYPQDPAFMDACDELGLFVIVNTPGWQFWNEDQSFEERVYSDIRNMVRRDRNHACVWLWEPILNETWYPEYFAQKAKNIVESEFPFKPNFTACDLQAKGSEYFPVLFAHPREGDQDKIDRLEKFDPNKTYFTREWGDNVDDWSAHNSPSRVSRAWGEIPMLIQAQHYAKPDYPYTSYDLFFKLSPQHVGGALWHSFDHQRGYHPDPFFGGIMDNFRLPKTAYFMFKSQRSPVLEKEKPFETGPFVYIAHEMTPFSPKDVTIYSNCDEVHLTFLKNGKKHIYVKNKNEIGLPSPIIVFKEVYDFMKGKKLIREKRTDEVFLRAEGIINGKVVATHEVHPAKRASKIMLQADWASHQKQSLEANGSDIVTVIASITDENGNIKRLNNSHIKFQIEGEGELVANEKTLTNPTAVTWGTAPILVKSTTKPGVITIYASVLFEGTQQPTSAQLKIKSEKSTQKLIFSHKEEEILRKSIHTAQKDIKVDIEKEKNEKKGHINSLKKVEIQQTEFGED